MNLCKYSYFRKDHRFQSISIKQVFVSASQREVIRTWRGSTGEHAGNRGRWWRAEIMTRMRQQLILNSSESHLSIRWKGYHYEDQMITFWLHFTFALIKTFYLPGQDDAESRLKRSSFSHHVAIILPRNPNGDIVVTWTKSQITFTKNLNCEFDRYIFY